MDANEQRVREILRQAKALAVEYYALTGRPLGVSGEVAELEAADALGLKLAAARTPGYDALGQGERAGVRFQIKGRAVPIGDRSRGAVPSISLKDEFDAVLLVLLDKTTLDALEIWEASRGYVERRLTEPGSKARNERGAMSIPQFKSDRRNNDKAQCVWISPKVRDYEEKLAAQKLAERKRKAAERRAEAR